MNRLLPIICMTLLLLLASPAAAEKKDPGFPVPETLNYELSWKGISAGESQLRSGRIWGGNLQMVSTAVSTGWVGGMYKVDDRLESIVELDTPWRAIIYHIKTLEGDHTKDREAFFYKDNTVQRINWENLRIKEQEVPREVYDPVSVLYHLRTLDLSPGKTYTMSIFDTKRLLDGRAEVMKYERIEVPAGEFDTVYVRYTVREHETGELLDAGGFDAWFTHDERRLPVRIRTKVPIGHLDAELVSISR